MCSCRLVSVQQKLIKERNNRTGLKGLKIQTFLLIPQTQHIQHKLIHARNSKGDLVHWFCAIAARNEDEQRKMRAHEFARVSILIHAIHAFSHAIWVIRIYGRNSRKSNANAGTRWRSRPPTCRRLRYFRDALHARITLRWFTCYREFGYCEFRLQHACTYARKERILTFLSLHSIRRKKRLGCHKYVMEELTYYIYLH